MENGIYKTSDILRLIDRKRNKNREGLPWWDDGSPDAKAAMDKNRVLNTISERVHQMASGRRHANDDAMSPVFDENNRFFTGDEFKAWVCPVCGGKVGDLFLLTNQAQMDAYCPDCGQRIDWTSVRKEYNHDGYSFAVNAEDISSIVSNFLDKGDEASTSMASHLVEALGQTPTVEISAEVGKPPVRVISREYPSEIDNAYIDEIQWRCPVCNWFVDHHRDDYYSGEKKRPCRFCDTCGQKIDWSNVELGDDYESIADS